MKILFILLHPGFTRVHRPTIEGLAEAGHEVILAFNDSGKNKDELVKVMDSLLSFGKFSHRITVIKDELPGRSDLWAKFSKAVNALVDYSRIYDEEYENTPKLNGRYIERIPVKLHLRLRRYRPKQNKFLLKYVMGAIYEYIPSSEQIEGFIKGINPDLMMITPLVFFDPIQPEYLRSAKALGIKTILCVNSWDNLTNKGLIKPKPDEIIVWNEFQRLELKKFHGITKSIAVHVTGAQCYDKWFERRPSVSRDSFYDKVGMDHSQPYVLYLCSSRFIAPNEIDFIRKWLKTMRSSVDPRLKNINVLIRPHPQNVGQWIDSDLSEFGSVRVYPKLGENPVTESGESVYYDSMYYSSAVVGINTSAQIESGILGKPVLTIESPEFAETQEGTLHYHYLVNVGLVKVATDLTSHIDQLLEVLNNQMIHKERIENFVRKFIRPYGLDVKSTPIVVEKIQHMYAQGVDKKNTNYVKHILGVLLIPVANLFNRYWDSIIVGNKQMSKSVQKWVLKGRKPNLVNKQ